MQQVQDLSTRGRNPRTRFLQWRVEKSGKVDPSPQPPFTSGVGMMDAYLKSAIKWVENENQKRL